MSNKYYCRKCWTELPAEEIKGLNVRAGQSVDPWHVKCPNKDCGALHEVVIGYSFDSGRWIVGAVWPVPPSS